MIFLSTDWMSFTAAYTVVLFPELAGPVTRMSPEGLWSNKRNFSRDSFVKPSSSTFATVAFFSIIRRATRSPINTGIVLILKSNWCEPTVSENRPSWGFFFSNELRFPRVFKTLARLSAISFGSESSFRRIPSFPIRILSSVSVGSICRSEAPSFTERRSSSSTMASAVGTFPIRNNSRILSFENLLTSNCSRPTLLGIFLRSSVTGWRRSREGPGYSARTRVMVARISSNL